MSLKVVLLTRTSRPSGAQMAWRLEKSGLAPVAVLVEKRNRMTRKKMQNPFALVQDFGLGFIWKRILEAFAIKSHFYFRRILGRRFKSPVYLSIEEWAFDHPEIPVHEVPDHNGPECQKLLREFRPDIGILTNTRRIKKEILEIPRHGFFNLHLSALPEYAGLDSIFWALCHGEKEIGVTVHFAAQEIDRGDIVLQRKVPVSRFDDENSLYQKALWLGTFLMTEALKQLEAGTLERTPQDSAKAGYFSWPDSKQRKEFRRRFKNFKEQAFHSSESPKIIHLITRMTRGGAQENTLATVEGLFKKGYEVTLVTGSSWGNEGEILSEALEKGIEVVMIPELEREIRPLKDLFVWLKLKSWLSKNNYALIHTHTSKAGFLGRLAARQAKALAVIHTPHGHVFHSYFSPWKEKLFLTLERFAAKRSDRLIALTDQCRKEHLALGVGKPEQWTVIPSGVDENIFLGASCNSPSLRGVRQGVSADDKAIPEPEIAPQGLSRSSERNIKDGIASLPPVARNDTSKPVIGFVGRFAPVKGAIYLIEAMPKILQLIPEAHCVLVGDGEEKLIIQERILGLGIEKSVTLAGHQKDIAAWMSGIDLLVVPSLNEGMGRVIVEAGFLAKPVIGTAVGGILDLIENGKTGLLVKSRSSDEIAAACVRLLQDSALRGSMGENLRQKVLAGFTEDHMVEKIHRLYEDVLAEKGVVQEIRQPV